MKLYVVIPTYNEEAYISKMLQSLVDQSIPPSKIVIVNDNSTDGTQSIVNEFVSKYGSIQSLKTEEEQAHMPGSKVINAFNAGVSILDDSYDIICKYDADLIFPKNYIEKILKIFKENPTCGMAGGVCYIQKGDRWELENLTNKDHIRGALKAYRKECFEQINGLRNTMGWDTVDELLAQFHGWNVCTETSLHVKHLKPTGASYTKEAMYTQGEAFYRMRYNRVLTYIASAKLARKKKSLRYFFNCILGFSKAKKNKTPYIVTKEEGVFIRNFRWENIKKRLRLIS